MRARFIFTASLALVVLALTLLFAGRGQLEEGYRIRSQTGQREFPAEQSRRGGALLYSSLPAAVGSAVCIFISRRRREPAWRWVSVVLLCIYVFVLIAPL